jgi:hypothetical protein
MRILVITFANVFTIACRGVEPAIRAGGSENTTPHFNEERLTNVNFNVERTALAINIIVTKAALRHLAAPNKFRPKT